MDHADALSGELEFAKSVIEELEAENQRLREERLAFATHAAEQKALLDRVREIPDFVENQSELMEEGDKPEWEYVVYLIRKALEDEG